MDPNTKKLLGALVAAALAIAVYYGLVSQQTATGIQNQADQTLGTTPTAQPTSPAQPTSTTQPTSNTQPTSIGQPAQPLPPNPQLQPPAGSGAPQSQPR